MGTGSQCILTSQVIMIWNSQTQVWVLPALLASEVLPDHARSAHFSINLLCATSDMRDTWWEQREIKIGMLCLARCFELCITLMIMRWTNHHAHLCDLLSDSNTNVNSMINRRVSLFYRYPLEASHHMVCPCTLDGVCVVCPGTSELVGQHDHRTLLWSLE